MNARSPAKLDRTATKSTLFSMTHIPDSVFSRPLLRCVGGLFAALVSMTAAEGHEFWIDPQSFSVETGATVTADLRVGVEYEGSAYSFFPKNFRQFVLMQGDDSVPVEGRLGDRPALSQVPPGEGLLVVVHETTDNKLTYSEFAKFETFVTHKDARWTLAAHADRGLPDAGFGEAYSRYAKSLVAVGEGAGQDRAFGLVTELVAGANPYTDDVSGGLPVTLNYEGKPRADAQVEIFEKAADGTVKVTTTRTDAAGQAVIPVKPGHRYMLDAVVLRIPSPALAEAGGVVWESLWANLTFEVPG